MFKVGEKVMCIASKWGASNYVKEHNLNRQVPLYPNIYTIREIRTGRNYQTGEIENYLLLEEIDNSHCLIPDPLYPKPIEEAWAMCGFRKLQSINQVEKLKEILKAPIDEQAIQSAFNCV